MCHSYVVGGSINHIHIITHIHQTLAPGYLVKDIKAACHSLIIKERAKFPKFPGWQVGYSGFTYHISSKKNLINYVLNQHIHHQTESYKDEIIRFLKEYEIDYKDEYLFE